MSGVGQAKPAVQQSSSGCYPQKTHAATHLPTRGQQLGRERNQRDDAGAAATAALRVDDLTKRVIALRICPNSSSGSVATTGGKNKIQTVPELKRELEGMCRTVFTTLGRQMPEFAYQGALQIELERRGITVQREAGISYTYRGEDITSRRVDLLLTLDDGSKVIVEIKAVQTITSSTSTRPAVQQLEHYLDIFDIDHGFLLNFPHAPGFPPPSKGGCFRQEPICGVRDPLSSAHLRGRKAGIGDDGPEIVYFGRVS